MKTLQITIQNARRLYRDATPEFQTTLEDTFGKDFFSQDPADWATSFEDFLSLEGKKAEDIYSESDDPLDIAEKKLKFIISVLNKGQSGIPKYYPVFIVSRSGFSYYDYDYGLSGTRVGARLRVFSTKNAIYIGKTFTDLYNIYMGY